MLLSNLQSTIQFHQLSCNGLHSILSFPAQDPSRVTTEFHCHTSLVPFHPEHFLWLCLSWHWDFWTVQACYFVSGPSPWAFLCPHDKTGVLHLGQYVTWVIGCPSQGMRFRGTWCLFAQIEGVNLDNLVTLLSISLRHSYYISFCNY